MKKLYTFLAVLLFTAISFAQTPEKMSYQAVVRDSGDALVTNQAVGMQISILQTTATGTAVYVETQTPMTNVNGLVTLEIGTGSVVSGNFTTIDWSAGPYFIKTETDPTGGSGYTITGTSELLSVPYALHSKTAGTLPGGIDQAYIEALEARITALEQVATPATVGDIRDGGVVFWVDPADNTHGLLCAFSDYGTTIAWGCYGTDLPSVPNVTSGPSGPGAEIGDGMTNTNAILTDCSTAQAALAARSYGPEWFLPSAKELNEMYINKATLEGVAGFTAFSDFYWSSTEIESYSAWIQYFVDGSQYTNVKANTRTVRAVRAF
jgi:hypothetical protein